MSQQERFIEYFTTYQTRYKADNLEAHLIARGYDPQEVREAKRLAQERTQHPAVNVPTETGTPPFKLWMITHPRLTIYTATWIIIVLLLVGSAINVLTRQGPVEAHQIQAEDDYATANETDPLTLQREHYLPADRPLEYTFTAEYYNFYGPGPYQPEIACEDTDDDAMRRFFSTTPEAVLEEGERQKFTFTLLITQSDQEDLHCAARITHNGTAVAQRTVDFMLT